MNPRGSLSLEIGEKEGTLQIWGTKPVLCNRFCSRLKRRIQIVHANLFYWMTTLKFPIFARARNAHVLNLFVPPKIPKCAGKGDPTKHLNNYKTRVSLIRVSPTLQLRVFHLISTGTAEIWYIRIPARSIRSWLDLKNSFLNKYYRVGKERPISKGYKIWDNKHVRLWRASWLDLRMKWLIVSKSPIKSPFNLKVRP